MIHVIHGNLHFYMYFTMFLNNPHSANMCQLRHMTSSEEPSFLTQKSVKNRSKIDAESAEKRSCDLDRFLY